MPALATGTLRLPLEINAAIRFLRWRIEASLLTPSTTFEADLAGERVYRQASEDDRVTLEQGFLDDTGTPQTLAVLTDGVIDEYALQRTRRGVQVHLTGRDAAALLIDREFTKRYVRFPGAGIQSGSTDVPTVTGVFTAQQVAAEVCASVGLSLAWQTRDYQLWDDFDANGRCIDILERLIAPWNVADPNHTDIFVEGTVVYIRKRTALPPTADYEYSVASGRIQNVTLRKRKLREFGTLTLRGRIEMPEATATAIAGPAQGFGGVITTTENVVEPTITTDPETGGQTIVSGTQEQRSVTQQYGANRALVGQVIEVKVYRTPDQVLLRSETEIWGIHPAEQRAAAAAASPEAAALGLVRGRIELLSKETAVYTWEDSLYDERGPVNQPLPLREEVVLRAWVDVPETAFSPQRREFVDTKSTTVEYAYDADRYLTAKFTSVWALVNGVFSQTESTTETLEDIGPLQVKRTVQQYRLQRLPDGTADWSLASSTSSTSAGHRPGGPNRSPFKASSSETAPNVSREVSLSILVPASPAVPTPSAEAMPAEGGDRNMSAADLAYIAGLYAEANALWETEIDFDALAIPWLRKGSILKITGHTGVSGTEIPLGNALVYQLVSDYDPTESKRAVSSIRAVFWSTEGQG